MDIKKKAEGFADPFRSASEWIPEGTPTHHDQLQYWVTQKFDNKKGMVTLAGDAAHPMPPRKSPSLDFRRRYLANLPLADRGQGLNHAVCDVGNLLEAIKSIYLGETGTSPEKAITGYDEELVKRGSAEVNLSVMNCLMVHDWNQFMNSPAMKVGIDKMS